MNTEIKTTPLFHAIKTILDAVDPEYLISSDVPEDEYENESAAIAERLTPNMNVPQIAAVIRDVMNKEFCTGRDEYGEQINPSYYGTDRYLSIAEEIYDSFGDLIDISSGKPEFHTQEPKNDDNPLPPADKNTQLTPLELIDSMFDDTAEDGTYHGLEPYHDDCEQELLEYKLRWKSDLAEAKYKLRRILQKIEKAAATGFMSATAEAYLTDLTRDLEYTFLADTGIINKDDVSDTSFCEEMIDSIITKKELEEELTEEEAKAYECYKAALSKAADEQVGPGLYSYELIQFARRYYRLLQLGAPKAVIDNEARNLAQTLVYHDYGWICNDQQLYL